MEMLAGQTEQHHGSVVLESPLDEPISEPFQIALVHSTKAKMGFDRQEVITPGLVTLAIASKINRVSGGDDRDL